MNSNALTLFKDAAPNNVVPIFPTSGINLNSDASDAYFTLGENTADISYQDDSHEPVFSSSRAFSVLIAELAAIGAVMLPGVQLSSAGPLLTVVEGLRVSALKRDFPGALASLGIKNLIDEENASETAVTYAEAAQKYQNAVSLGYHC